MAVGEYISVSRWVAVERHFHFWQHFQPKQLKPKSQNAEYNCRCCGIPQVHACKPTTNTSVTAAIGALSPTPFLSRSQKDAEADIEKLRRGASCSSPTNRTGIINLSLLRKQIFLRRPRSQKDAEEADIEKERREQAKGHVARQHELEELAQIYVNRGLTPQLAMQVGGRVCTTHAWHHTSASPTFRSHIRVTLCHR